jgi:hypothetical protein
MLTVSHAVLGTGGSLAGIYDLEVPHGRDGQRLIHDQTAAAANDPRGASRLGTGGGDKGENLIVMGGAGSKQGLFRAAEGADPFQKSQLGTSGRNGGFPFTESVEADVGTGNGGIGSVAGHKAQGQGRKEQPQSKQFFQNHISTSCIFLIIAQFGGTDMKNRVK